MDSGVVHKLAVLAKDYYSIRTIGDLFLVSGAEPVSQVPSRSHGSQRMDAFYGWIEGMREHYPDHLDRSGPVHRSAYCRCDGDLSYRCIARGRPGRHGRRNWRWLEQGAQTGNHGG